MLLFQLAHAKMISPEVLKTFGLEEKDGAVLIPYCDETGHVLVKKQRTNVKATAGSYWPKGVPLMPYGLNVAAKLREKGQQWLILVEGESDCWTLWRHELPALGVPGAGAGGCLKAEHVRDVHELYIHVENDSAGQQFVQGLQRQLAKIGFAGDVFTFSVPAPHKDVNDYYRALVVQCEGDFPGALGRLMRNATPLSLAAGELTRMSDVAAEHLEWLWPERVPANAITVLDGDPGLGKSSLSLDLAARVTTGQPMPFSDKTRPPGQVLLLSAEDDFARVVKPRLQRCGADLKAVLAKMDLFGGDKPFLFPYCLADLGRILSDFPIRLVIVDPLMAFFAGSVDSNKDADVRRVFAELKELAEQRHSTILVIRHLNKSNVGKAIYRGGGSIGIVGAARSALLVGRDPEYPDKALLAVTKSNYAQMPPSIRYSINNDAGSGLIHWEAETGHDADELLATYTRDRDKQIQLALAFLKEFLGDGQAHAAGDVLAAGALRQLSVRTLYRARDQLHIAHNSSGHGLWQLVDGAS